jgi:predicted dienelactone hydrolase
MYRRHFCWALSAAGLAGCAASRTARRVLPPNNPINDPGTADDVWTDPLRSRDVLLRIRWPAGDAPCALVIHSHGLGGSREGGDVWGRAWQDAGMAVVHVQHAGSDIDTLRSGGMGGAAIRGAISAEQLIARVADMRFVLDEIERRQRSGGLPWRRVRLDAIGASGHSFGAHTVQALAGQRYADGGPPPADSRLRAFIALSPSPGRGQTRAQPQTFAAITRPMLLVTGSLDDDPIASPGGADLKAEGRASVFDALPTGARALLWLHGADHMTFAGNAERRIQSRFAPFKRDAAVAANEDAHHAIVARISALWWRARLLGDAAALSALRAPTGLGANDRWRID